MMHSFGYRANALLTFAVTILAIMCALASLSDNLNTPSPKAQIEVLNINWFQRQPNGNDEVSLTLNISADLQSLFTWNTKQIHGFGGSIRDFEQITSSHQVFVFVAAEYQTPKNALNQVFVFVAAEYQTPKNALNQVSLWDGIIPSKDHANFWIHTTNKYSFIDQGSNLRGQEFNLTMHWHVMPKTGYMFADKRVISGFRLPDEYR